MSAPEQFVVLQAGGAHLALPQADVAEILPLPLLERPAGAPRLLAGFANLGGMPLPVLHMARLLGAETEEGEPDLYSHILRLKPSAGASVGLLVDRVTDAAAAAEGRAPVDPADSLNGVVGESLVMAGRLLPLLAPERLLTALERARIEEMGERLQARLDEWDAPER